MDTKHCKECGDSKPLDEFYQHHAMADGRLNICKKCKRDYAARRREEKLVDPFWVERERVRSLEKYYRLYATHQKWVSIDAPPEVKKQARSMVQAALKSGRLAKDPFCLSCGSDEPLEGHHRDYYKPLDVIWLCKKCHADVHIISAKGEIHELLTGTSEVDVQFTK